jgi:putative transposase
VRSLAEEEDKTMTFYDFPHTMHRYIRTTNAIESLWSLVRQRTDQIDVFTTEMSCLTIVWATIEGIPLRRIPIEETERCQRKGQYSSIREG